MTPEIVITIGLPGSGKSTIVKPLIAAGYVNVNRDVVGGNLDDLKQPIYQEIRRLHRVGHRQFIVDGTFFLLENRAAIIAVGKELGLPVRAMWLQVPLEQAQLFASRRQVQRYGKLFEKADYKANKGDPNMFPPAAQFAFRKRFVEPTIAEGFVFIEEVFITTSWGDEYVNKAILIDLDGTVRETPDSKAKVKKGCPWPRNAAEVLVTPGCGAVLRRYKAEGYLILAVTNQSGVSRKTTDAKFVSDKDVVKCIEETERQLGIKFDDYLYATDRGGPPSTFWRKPCPGMGVVFTERYKLDPAKCVMVGDMTSDKTFATRCGFAFQWAHDFFAAG